MKLADYYRDFAPRLGACYADRRGPLLPGTRNTAGPAALDEVLSETKEGEGLRGVRDSATVLALQLDLLPRVRKYAEAVDIYSTWEKAARSAATSPAKTSWRSSGWRVRRHWKCARWLKGSPPATPSGGRSA